MAKSIGRYVICRTRGAGCFAGNVESESGTEVVLTDVRRLWYWEGAASLSELATRGTSRPAKCKFPVAMVRVKLTEVTEVIDTTTAAEKSIKEVPIWTA